jgi:AraC-like DNA-binding protein
MAHVPCNRLRTIVFQAGLKAGFCPALASSGPVCPGIALLLAHCLTARPLPPAYGLGDGAKALESRQSLPVAALHQLWQDRAGMNESEKQFSFTRAASSTSGRAKNQISVSWPERAQEAKYSVKALAKACGVSVRVLEMFFCAAKREPPRCWLKGLRMERAIELFRDGCNVNQTAECLGYRDRSHFSREFKKHFGLAPKRFAASAETSETASASHSAT